MLRLGLATIHSLLAASVALAMVFPLGQALLNRSWELGFYGQISAATRDILFISALSEGMALVVFLTAIAYARQWRWGRPLMAGWGAFLLFRPPLQALGLVTLGLVMMEIWSRRPVLPPSEEGGA